MAKSRTRTTDGTVDAKDRGRASLTGSSNIGGTSTPFAVGARAPAHGAHARLGVDAHRLVRRRRRVGLPPAGRSRRRGALGRPGYLRHARRAVRTGGDL